MTNIYYQEQVLENIARKVLCGYDSICPSFVMSQLRSMALSM